MPGTLTCQATDIEQETLNLEQRKAIDYGAAGVLACRPAPGLADGTPRPGRDEMAITNRFAPPVISHTDILDMPAAWPAPAPERAPSGLLWWTLLAVGIVLR